jgi:hypothetical protein
MARFGDDSAGSSSFPCSGDRALLSQFTLTEGADVTEIVAIFESTTTAGSSFKGLIYADSGGAPGALVAVGAATAIPAGASETASACSVSLAAGTYWLGLVTDSFEARVQCDASGGLSRMEAATYSSPAATWSQSGTGTARLNVYAECTAATVDPIPYFRQQGTRAPRGGAALWGDDTPAGVVARNEFFGEAVDQTATQDTGFADGDAFGAGTIANAGGDQTLTQTAGYADGDAFGAGAASLGAAGSGFADGDAFGGGSLSVAVTGSGFGDGDGFGAGATVTVAFGSGFADGDGFGGGAAALGVTATGYADGDGFGAGTVSVAGGPQTLVQTAGHADADGFGAGAAGQGVAGSGFADGDGFGSGSFTATVEGTGLTDADGFGGGVIIADQVLIGSGFADADAFGSGVVTDSGAPNPNAADSPRRVGASPVVVVLPRLGDGGDAVIPRIGSSSNSKPPAAVGERALGAPDRRVGSSTVRTAQRRIG